jgi:membrane-anchored protein YejM (alkaline phosphatase superfamily)
MADRAFRLDEEPGWVRAVYGNHLFARGCLVARRLIEASVAIATVYWHYEGPADSPVWDSHANIFPAMRTRLAPPADQAIAALLEDLSSRGMLDETLVVCLGEFGRTPRFSKASRGHWPHAQSILLAGAGVPAGSVYGATDRLGAYPADRAMTPGDLAATILHLMGVDPATEFHDALGRPFVASTGRAVPALLGDA